MSTYSTNLALELIGTGEQAGTWGNTTNTNLGTLIEQAISGYVTQAVATGTDTTLTIPNGATGVARNMYIELTGTGGTNTNLVVPANKKLYFIYNNSTGAVTVKVSGQTGVSVAATEKKILVSNGTDIVEATSYITAINSSLTLTTLNATSANITTLSGTAVNYGSATISTGNLTFSSTGQRITGDMANATLTNRLAFQNSVTNANTPVNAIPNGTGTGAGFRGYGASDPTNAPSVSVFQIGTTDSRIASEINGTASYTPLTFYTGGSERMRLDTSGNLGIGTASPAFASGDGLEVQRAADATVRVERTGATASAGEFVASSGLVKIGATSGSPFAFITDNTERMRIDGSTGNVGIGGTAAASVKISLSGTAPSSSGLTFGYYQNMTLPSSTTSAYLTYTVPAIASGATVTTLGHFYASQGTFTGTATNQYGFVAESSLTGATNNFGFYSNIASGSNRWNFYAAGTARNYFAGGVEDAAGNLRNIPSAGAAKTSAYTLSISDIGEFVTVGSGGSITVPNDVFAAGNAVSIYNDTTGNISINCPITTAYLAGTNTDRASLTLATRGIATVLFINPSLCVASGNLT